jgi:molecular chaperone GrpE
MQEQEKTRDQDQTVRPDSIDQTEQAEKPVEAAAQPESPAAGSPAGNEGESLEARLAAAEARATEMQDAFLRAKAEAENIRRRAQEDISKAHKFAIENFAESMVPVKDSLEMALKLDTPTIESLKEGVEMTLKQLSAAFDKNRLLEINPQPGEKLDPMRHQAISMVPADQAANTIVSVLQKGYMIADRLLRPALVTVAQ